MRTAVGTAPALSGRPARKRIAAGVLGAVLALSGAGMRLPSSECGAADVFAPPSSNDLAALRDRPGAALSAWIALVEGAEPVPVSIVMRPEQNIYSAQLYLPPEYESFLSGAIRMGRIESFGARTSGGKTFYTRGFCRRGIVRDACSGLEIGFTFVPFTVAGRDNPAFGGDLGLLRLEAPAAGLLESPDSLLRVAFDRLVPVHGVPVRELYPLMEAKFGMPHRLAGKGFDVPVEALVLPPVHKLSAGKHLREPAKKLDADLKNLVSLLATDSGLLSQRERLRRGLVPDSVKLNWSRIDDTDIGSGQNQFVFLTMGPGINYFDGPWRSKTSVLPGPRVILDPAVVNFADTQIYPSYSIDPTELGEGRLRAINRFQVETADSRRDAVPMPIERRGQVIRELAEALCRYGLLNDDQTLEAGFTFMGSAFRGNIVNNELRLRDGLSLRDWAIGVIVPPGAAGRARELLSEIGYDDEAGPGGIPLSEFVIEAPFPTDAGFRQAYLELVMRRSLPALYRIIRLLRPAAASRQGIRPGYGCAMKAVDRLIRREGFAFLERERSFEASWRWTGWRTAWSEYREAVFHGDDEAMQKRLRQRALDLQHLVFQE